MISYEKLAEKPRVFKSITGLDIEEFEQLFGKLVPVWVAVVAPHIPPARC